ncbi:Predicted metal-binding protein [Acetitomaculum ruminis DSM 5522]|uniref:Predicted metal-binding protein n=1 Tax=Acetitomaculum ruminis DSM 5522 TaxID=1120918 RepID=A0A1I0WLH9_9FIRM|nr:DUF2284 domain-containing protein [Acetitomaculum ruminis]SFA89058.1 Predicted metal-binding protein [Acetitomaculum ruminis DSM 5522]
MGKDYLDVEKVKNFLEELIVEYPICEYAYGDAKDIPFSDKIFTVCETDCVRYNKSWACPPHAGTIDDNIKRIGKYKQFMVFSTVWEVSDSMNYQACLFMKKEHESLTRDFRKKLLNHFDLEEQSLDEDSNPPIYILSSGCTICDECTCPKEPCRHPKERLMTAESHGILLVQVLEDLGLTSSYDGTTVVYFTMVLFGKEDE